MKTLTASGVFLGALLTAGADAGLVRFDHDAYEILPGEAFPVQIHLDANPATLDIEPVAGGLFSFGIGVMLDPTRVAAITDGTSVPQPIDFRDGGFVPGADLRTEPGFAGAAGSVNFLAFEPYEGTLLLSLLLQDMSDGPGTYTIDLDFYHGSGRTNFVGFAGGQSLDGQLSLGSATVNVVPEPSAILLLAGAGGLLALRRR